MQRLRQKWFSFPAIMLGAVLLRAFVPAGYMPAAPGQGLLFELCDAGLPTSFSAALNEHAHHGSHDVHEQHSASGDCSFGHILAGAAIDAPKVPVLAIEPAVTTVPAVISDVRFVQRVYARAPRGPPPRKQ